MVLLALKWILLPYVTDSYWFFCWEMLINWETSETCLDFSPENTTMTDAEQSSSVYDHSPPLGRPGTQWSLVLPNSIGGLNAFLTCLFLLSEKWCYIQIHSTYSTIFNYIQLLESAAQGKLGNLTMPWHAMAITAKSPSSFPPVTVRDEPGKGLFTSI